MSRPAIPKGLPSADVVTVDPNEETIVDVSHGDLLWRDQDRFPLGARGGDIRLSDEAPSESGVRPFAMQEVRYGDAQRTYRRADVVVLCPDQQIGLVNGRPLREVYSRAPSMTKYDTDGKDVLVVDYAEDD